MSALLEKYPLEEWEIQWSAGYGGPGALKCILVHRNVAGQLLGDIRNYLDRPGIQESIIEHGTTYGPEPTKPNAKEMLMTTEDLLPLRKLLGIDQ